MINLSKNGVTNTLYPTDYVIYDKANDHVLQDSYGRVLIFGNPDEAFDDLYANEVAIPCTELPIHWQEIILEQLKNNE